MTPESAGSEYGQGHDPGKGKQMATMIERQAASVQKELDKLIARLAREQARLVKKTAAAEKLGANCTSEEWFGGKRDEFTPEQAWSWIDMEGSKREIADLERQIANAEKRLAKLTGKVEAQQEANAAKEAEETRIGQIETRFLTAEQVEANRKRKEEEYQKWLAEFKAECLKDGIKIDKACASYFTGWTKGGKRFFIDGNCGYTVRSRHCYSLRIDGVTLFTSGEFFTAYRYLMKH